MNAADLLFSPRRAALLAGALVLLLGAPSASSVSQDHVGDVWHYFTTARLVLHGQLPYRDFPLEYPPLCLVPFLLPRLMLWGHAAAYAHYVWAFLFESALLTAALTWTVLDIANRFRFSQPPRVTFLLLALFLAAAAPVLPWRYDLFPALLTALAFRALLGARHWQAGVWLGLGAAAKLYPLVLLPVFALSLIAGGQWRGMNRVVFGCLGTLVACFLPSLCLSPATAFSFLHPHALRGLEVEGLAAGLILLSHSVMGTPVTVVYNFGADHLVSPVAPFFLAGLPTLFLFALAGTLLRIGRRGIMEPETLARGATAALVAMLLFNKVFSPQYLLWLLPFAPLLSLRASIAVLLVFALTSLLTTAAFPGLLALHVGPILLLNARNGLVFAIFVSFLLPVRAGSRRAASSPGGIPCVQS